MIGSHNESVPEMKITADEHTCIGAGQCVMHAPKLFTQSDETGLVVVLQSEVSSAEDREAAEMAERSCPVRALKLSE